MAATDDPGELDVEGEPDADGEPDAEPVLEEPLGKLPEPLVVPPLIEFVLLPEAPGPELAVFSFTWPLGVLYKVINHCRMNFMRWSILGGGGSNPND